MDVVGVKVSAIELLFLRIVNIPSHQTLYLVLEPAQRWVDMYFHPNYQVQVVVVEVFRNQITEQQNAAVEEDKPQFCGL